MALRSNCWLLLYSTTFAAAMRGHLPVTAFRLNFAVAMGVLLLVAAFLLVTFRGGSPPCTTGPPCPVAASC